MHTFPFINTYHTFFLFHEKIYKNKLFIYNDNHFLIQSNNSTNTPNGHKGTTYQGDSTLGSPARRCEVSPIQNHVSIPFFIYITIDYIFSFFSFNFQ